MPRTCNFSEQGGKHFSCAPREFNKFNEGANAAQVVGTNFAAGSSADCALVDLRSCGKHVQADFEMSEFPTPANDIGKAQIQLIDSSSGRPIRVWNFCDQASISIGRSTDQLVDIGDPYVSRNHARVDYRNGEWFLISLGRHGVVVANQLVTEYKIGCGQIFRLGFEGPTLRFQLNTDSPAVDSTFHFDSIPEFSFQLNEEKLQNEVGEIAEGNYFLQLQARAKQMRRDRRTD